MAVNFTKKNPYDLVDLIDPTKGLSSALELYGIQVMTSMKGFLLATDAHSVVVPKLIPLAQLKSGTTSQNLLNKQYLAFKQGFTVLSNLIKAGKDLDDVPPFDNKNTVGDVSVDFGSTEVKIAKAMADNNDKYMPKAKKVMTKTDPPIIIGPTSEAPKQKVVPVVSPVEIMQGFSVELLKATQVYQPVKSTSEGSIYYTVALMPDLKIAARLKGTKVSVRAEGSITKHKDSLALAGFTIHDEKYASFHVDASTSTLRGKVIGAALFGLGLKFGQMANDISLLEDKGV